MDSSRIVVIDDSPTACAIVRRLLEREWWVVETYLQPLPALASLWQQASTPPAALILAVDLAHPQLDGYTMTHLFRQQAPRSLRSVPIIGLTAGDGVIARIKRRLVGMDACLITPFDPADLLATLPRRRAANMHTRGDTQRSPGWRWREIPQPSSQILRLVIGESICQSDPWRDGSLC